MSSGEALRIAAEEYKAAVLAEQAAKGARLACERKILELLKKPETHEGTETVEDIKVSYKLKKTVDTGALQEAVAAGLLSHERAGELFRWKAEINARERASDDEQAVLNQITTAKPAKPSFRIVATKEK